MPLICFNDLVERFGEVVAYATLTEIERAAQLPFPSKSDPDPETRLARALAAQDAAWAA